MSASLFTFNTQAGGGRLCVLEEVLKGFFEEATINFLSLFSHLFPYKEQLWRDYSVIFVSVILHSSDLDHVPIDLSQLILVLYMASPTHLRPGSSYPAQNTCLTLFCLSNTHSCVIPKGFFTRCADGQ